MARRRAPWMLEADALEAERKAARPRPEFGVFRYDPANKYHRADAVRVYLRRADADRAAEAGFPDLVVREIR